MGFVRVEITAKHVREALDAAAGKDSGVDIWADTRLPYLQLRRRDGSVKWMVRGMKTLRTIGDVRERHPKYLSVKTARERATEVYTELRYGEAEAPVSADDAPAGWTWADLDREYQAMIAQPRWVNRRMKPPSKGTVDDVRLAFAKPSFVALHGRRLAELDRPAIHAARDAIESHRQREKNVAYFKAAMTWAADKHPDASGLVEGVDRWWERVTAGDPDAMTMHAIEERRKIHRQQKADLDVEAIARTLVAHEAYCANRTEEDRISPGVRWGIWWVAFTANRRASTVQLRREHFLEQDPLGENGWGRAAWPPDAMKAKTEFWLPLPPVVRDIAAGSMAEWQRVVDYGKGKGNAGTKTQWVFASQQRRRRDDVKGHGDIADLSIYPNSLNRYLQRMRADGALDGLPLFNPHLVRSPMGDLIAGKVSGVAASLVLAHTLPNDADEAAPTTRAYYLTSQRMAEKTAGMKAWSEAVVEAYLKAGGTMPAPREALRSSRLKRKPPDSQPGAILG